MQFETRQRATPMINLSALIDIAFILVIFVVLAASFQRVQTMEVSLPSAKASHNANPQSLVISVPVSGPVTIDGKSIPAKRIESVLASMYGKFTSVLIVADRKASVQRAVTLLSKAQSTGFSTVSIAIQEEGTIR